MYSDILYELVPSSKEEDATSSALVPDQVRRTRVLTNCRHEYIN
jgi:hypothetical protein